MFWCTCAECGIKKFKFVKSKKLDNPAVGAGVMDTVAGTVLEIFVHHGLPWMGKKQLRWEDITVQRSSETLNYRKKLSITL